MSYNAVQQLYRSSEGILLSALRTWLTSMTAFQLYEVSYFIMMTPLHPGPSWRCSLSPDVYGVVCADHQLVHWPTNTIHFLPPFPFLHRPKFFHSAFHRWPLAAGCDAALGLVAEHEAHVGLTFISHPRHSLLFPLLPAPRTDFTCTPNVTVIGLVLCAWEMSVWAASVR